MEKRPERRFQSASDLGFALEALSAPSDSRLETAPLRGVAENEGEPFVRNRERLTWLVAVMALSLGVLGFAWAYFKRQPLTNDAREMKYSIAPPEKSSFGQIAVSPDGRLLAFTAATGGKVQLWVQALNSTEARALDHTQGAYFPFWSPDSRFIAFTADGKLKKIEVTGGPVQPLCDASLPLGGAWSRDGVILFGLGMSGLARVSATGGEVTRVTSTDRSRQEITHRPHTFLPDGRHFLYSIQSGQNETRGVYLGSLDDGTVKRRLLDNVTMVKYVAAVPGESAGGAGWLVFGRDGALLARPFDTDRFDFTGEQLLLSDKIGGDVVSITFFNFSASENGVLVFDPSLERQRRQYRWVDRHGQTINLPDAPAGGTFNHSISPDGKRFIADLYDLRIGTSDLWLYDVSGGNPRRFTFDTDNDLSPVWSPDGSRIVWTSTRDVVSNLYWKAASLDGKETLLWKSDYIKIPTDWSREGIIYSQTEPRTKWDVWLLPAPESGKANPYSLIHAKYNETAATLSPNGRWLAYSSDELGRSEIYVQSFPDGSGKRQVSNGGGNGPRWRRDGTELFYYSGDGRLRAVQVKRGDSFEFGADVPLFEFRAGTIRSTFGSTPYAVTADGQRFLINEIADMEPNAPLTVMINWTAGMKKEP